MSNTVPNLDAMSEDELMVFYNKHRLHRRKDAEALVGDKRPGYTNIAGSLAHYSINKAVAMKCRREGNINGALCYENICERIYHRLPEDIQW